MNINDPSVGGSQGQTQAWGPQTTDQPVKTTQIQNREEIEDLKKDTVTKSDSSQGPHSTHNSANATAGRPALGAPTANASTYPMSPAGGNPWSEASGFVAVLVSLQNVAAKMARNALLDNKTIVEGTKAQYEMGVEAGKMQRDAKYAEAMADIANGVGQMVAGAASLATAGFMAKVAADGPSSQSAYKTQADATQVKMDQRATQIQETRIKQRDEMQAELGQMPPGTDRDKKQEAIDDKQKEIDQHASNVKAVKDNPKDVVAKEKMEDELAALDPQYAALRQQRDSQMGSHSSHVIQEAANKRTLIGLVGDGLKQIAGGAGQMAGAPFKMLEGNYSMWAAIFQTAGQCFDKFIGALTNDMQSAQQMIDSLNQLEQKLSDENTRAMSHNA